MARCLSGVVVRACGKWLVRGGERTRIPVGAAAPLWPGPQPIGWRRELGLAPRLVTQ